MKKKIANNLLIFAAALVVWMLLLRLPIFQGDSVEHTTDTVRLPPDTITLYDTLYMDSLVYDTMWYPTPADTMYVDADTGEPTLLYKGESEVDGFTINYSANVTGVLNNISFGLSGKYPIETKVITKKEIVTNEIFHKPKGLYVGGTFHGNTLSLGASYVLNKNMFSIGYGMDGSIHLGYKYRIL